MLSMKINMKMRQKKKKCTRFRGLSFDVHEVLLDRARTIGDFSLMTRFDASMSVEQILAKLCGISIEEAADRIKRNHAADKDASSK
jgi:hypothetical protein